MTSSLGIVTILVLAFFQNVSFSIVSRSRNRNNMRYHLIASVLSNGVWFLTFRELVLAEMSVVLFVPYCLGTVSGSLLGAKVSMRIERWLGAVADEPKNAGLTVQQKAEVVVLIENCAREISNKSPAL